MMIMALMVVWFSRGTFAFLPLTAVNTAMVPATLTHGGHHLVDLLAGWLARMSSGAEELRLLLGVGVLGGFTTFSAFSLEIYNMITRAEVALAAAYAVSSVAGSVLAAFGGRLPDGRPSDGLLIAGTAGAEVRAAAPGRVAYSDWLKGYGLLTIVDHGDGWMSLYAFNDALLKDVGDWVRAGDPLATVGSSGGQGRPALYFELRRNGQPQDPKPWFKP